MAKQLDTAMHVMTGPPKCPAGRRPSTTARARGQGWEFGRRGAQTWVRCANLPGAMSSIPETPENKSRGRGVLDRPVKPDDESSLRSLWAE
jgi:hypothetical protein